MTQKYPGRHFLEPILPYNMGSVSGGVQESLKPGQPGIRILSLLGALHEGSHVAATQQTGQWSRQRRVPALFLLHSGQESMNLCASEMTAEEGQGAGSDQRDNPGKRVAEEEEERQWRSWHDRRIHQGAQSELRLFRHGLHFIEDDDFPTDTDPMRSQKFTDAVADGFHGAFVTGVQIHGSRRRRDIWIHVGREGEGQGRLTRARRAVEDEMWGILRMLRQRTEEVFEDLLAGDIV